MLSDTLQFVESWFVAGAEGSSSVWTESKMTVPTFRVVAI